MTLKFKFQNSSCSFWAKQSAIFKREPAEEEVEDAGIDALITRTLKVMPYI